MSEVKQNDLDLDILVLWRSLLTNIYSIILIFSICLSLWLIFFIYSPRIYQIDSLIQIESGNDFGRFGGVDKVLFGQESINLEEQIAVYKSFINLSQLIDELQLDVEVNSKKNELRSLKDLKFNNYNYDFGYGEVSKLFVISLNNIDDTFNILDNEKLLAENLEWDKDYVFDRLSLNIQEPKNKLSDYKIIIKNKNDLVNTLKKTITVNKLIRRESFTGGATSILVISYLSENQELAKEILNTSNNIYLNQSLNIKKVEAQTSLEFIKNQLKNVKNELEINENLLNIFKTQNMSIDLEAETLAFIEKAKDLSLQLTTLDLQEVDAKSLYKEGNPLLNRIQAQRRALKEELNFLNSQIELFPESQQEYINLVRNVKVTQTIYESLLERELEFSLAEASTLGNVRVIDPAYVVEKVAPSGFTSLLTTLIIAAFFSFIMLIYRTFSSSVFKLPSELLQRYPDITLLGVLPKFEKDIFTKHKDKLPFEESIETLITNTLIASSTHGEDSSSKTKNNIIQVFGASPGIGKTSISYFLAEGLRKRNKKVLLIDFDFKRGDLHKIFGISKISREDFNKFLKEAYEGSVDQSFLINENLYFIPRAENSSSKSLEIIESPLFKNAVESLRKKFDFVIFDTPPMLSVSDSISLSRFTNLDIFVVLHNSSKISDIRQSTNAFEIVDKKIEYMVFNQFQKPRGWYYYDYYAYKYYKNYDYYRYDDK